MRPSNWNPGYEILALQCWLYLDGTNHRDYAAALRKAAEAAGRTFAWWRGGGARGAGAESPVGDRLGSSRETAMRCEVMQQDG